MTLSARLFLLATLALFSLGAGAAERTTYFVPDAQGSPVAAMDDQGAVLWRESYAPYGQRQARPAANNARPAYTGKPEDPDTGFVYMGARMYDPETARFTGVDPQGFKDGDVQTFGRYVYANNSPYRYKDPNGESPSPVEALIAAYDAAAFALAMQSGDPLAMAEAAADLKDDAKGLAIPIPGAGALLKLKRAEKAAEKIAGSSSKRIDWPPNRGFADEAAPATLVPGAKVDRYGGDEGTFVASAGTPFPERSLPSGYENKPLHTYEVRKPIDVSAGETAGWFGQPGGGMQFELQHSVKELLGSGHLEEVH